MTAADWTYVGMAVLFSVALVAVVYRTYRAARLQQFRYQLFAVRDELFGHVATGAIDENSILFQEGSRLMNTTIRHIKEFTIENLARAVLEHGEEAEASERAERITTALQESPPEVQATFLRYTGTMLHIFYANSIRIRLWLKARSWARGHLRRIKELWPRPLVYKAYRWAEDREARVRDVISHSRPTF